MNRKLAISNAQMMADQTNQATDLYITAEYQSSKKEDCVENPRMVLSGWPCMGYLVATFTPNSNQ